MFRGALHLPFKLLGIPIKLDRSFLLILPLLAWMIGSQLPGYVALFQSVGVTIDPAPLERGVTPFLLGLLAALGLFVSVLIHELGHAVAARLYGVETKEITLWFLGGVAQFTELPRQRGAEAVVAIVGPLVSFVLALLAWGLMRGVTVSALLFIFSYLAVTNAALALFNLLPALPLDGGRVLRSLLALRLGNLRATRISATVSRIVAVLLGLYGLLNAQLFTVIIAFFIYNAVRAETQYAQVTNAFESKTVRDLMATDVVTVPPDMTLGQFSQLIFYRKHRGYPVVAADGRLLGFAKLQDANGAPEQAQVSDIMVAADTIGADEDALSALKRVSSSDVGRLVVVDPDGRMVGIVGKTDLIRTLQSETNV